MQAVYSVKYVHLYFFDSSSCPHIILTVGWWCFNPGTEATWYIGICPYMVLKVLLGNPILFPWYSPSHILLNPLFPPQLPPPSTPMLPPSLTPPVPTTVFIPVSLVSAPLPHRGS